MAIEINEGFIETYSSMVEDSVCKYANINPADKYSKAIYAYNQLHPNAPITRDHVNYGDSKEFYVCEDGQVYDAQRNTYIMDVISALLHPEEFRTILFERPTNKFRERPKNVYVGHIVYSVHFLPLRHLYDEMLYATNTLSDSITLQRWKPLIRAFTTYSYVGLNLITTDIYGNTYQLAPEEKGGVLEAELITDGTVLFNTGESRITDMSRVDDDMRYKSPHHYIKKN